MTGVHNETQETTDKLDRYALRFGVVLVRKHIQRCIVSPHDSDYHSAYRVVLGKCFRSIARQPSTLLYTPPGQPGGVSYALSMIDQVDRLTLPWSIVELPSIDQ